MTTRDEAVAAVGEVLAYLGGRNGARFDQEVYDHTPDRWIAFLESATDGMGEPEAPKVRFQLADSGPVRLSEVTFYSLCEHHLLPFFGNVTIEYSPTDSVVGISALVHIVERHAHRLQLQERMTRDIAQDVAEMTGSDEVKVGVVAEHLCMSMRGVTKPGIQVSTQFVASAKALGEAR
ncbi:GTP cyclohydrolase I [Ferrimicrobium sp.]|uniref:GTP cyclohydrolase I n=1 Tax=Ferrimicrobium sp. TaxID=2926050 RepID=UPI00260DD340|nr:GTP cyclohydrolase I [Ferrimicrobium sp.]